MNKSVKIIAIGLIVILCTVGLVYAATTLTNPVDENVIGTPTSSPSPSPTPTATVTPTAIHLSSNNTVPFYKGDTLRMIAQLNQPVAGITVTLYNHGSIVTTMLTNSTGAVVFDRQPQNPFNYSISAAT